MREQPAQIQNVFVADVEVIRELLCGPQDHNAHCMGWRWHLYMQDTKLRAAAVREEGLRIITRRRNEQIVCAILPSYEEALQNSEMARILFDASKGGNVRGITEDHRYELANVFQRQAAE